MPIVGPLKLAMLVSQSAAAKIGYFDRYGAILLLGVLLMDNFAHTGIFYHVLGLPIQFVVQFLTQEAFPLLASVINYSFS